MISILILPSLSACSNDGKDSSDIIEMKIGVALYKDDDTFISTIKSNLETIAKQKELDTNSRITLNFQDAKGSQANQNDQVSRFISQEYDVICVNIVDRTAAASIIDKAKNADIPVIFFNREPVEEDMKRWDKTYYVGGKADESGAIQANLILDRYISNKSSIDKNLDGKIQYVMLEGEYGHQDALIRTEYCIDTLVKNGVGVEKLANETGNWQRAQGNAKMTKWIKKYGSEIEVVFSNNDDMALGALDAMKTLNILGNSPIVVGVDGTPQALQSIKDGYLYGTVISDSEGQANSIFDLAYTLTRKGNVNAIKNLKDEIYIRTEHTPVTAENVDLFINRE